jgi:hypothetical protein
MSHSNTRVESSQTVYVYKGEEFDNFELAVQAALGISEYNLYSFYCSKCNTEWKKMKLSNKELEVRDITCVVCKENQDAK